jgi:hypothetical protein
MILMGSTYRHSVLYDLPTNAEGRRKKMTLQRSVMRRDYSWTFVRITRPTLLDGE